MAERLGRKQTMEQAQWEESISHIRETHTKAEIMRLAEETIKRMEWTARGKNAAFAWSGGKDSMVLESLCYHAGIWECMMGMCDLEYPAFLQWVTDHMPPLIEMVHTGQDLLWLAANPDMLFPQDSPTAAHWFKIVQHTAQAAYVKKRKVDILLLGRRRMDGNYTGPQGADIYTNAEGVTRYSPLRDWTHEHILAYISYFEIPLPPIYGWPNGYRVGTGPWPARQWTGSIRQGWREVYTIDPGIVHGAAVILPSARQFLEEEGVA